jgi:ferritin-like metal-binding protein YciE
VSTPVPPTVKSPRDLLVDDLKRLLTVETTLAKMLLPKLMAEVQNDELKSALQHHHEETKQHVENVRQAFRQLGVEPEAKEAQGLEGLAQEHASGMGAVAPSLRETFDAGAAIGTEHYEIAIYSGALLLATSIGNDEVAELLGSNLEQEFAALKKLEGIAERLAQRAAANGA